MFGPWPPARLVDPQPRHLGTDLEAIVGRFAATFT
jgi:hypothetical protein